MARRIYLSPPDTGPLEEEYLVRALRSGWVAPVGPDIDAFEGEVAQRVGVEHALAMSSGTAALHLALLGVGVRPGDAVVVPTLTFAATAHAVCYTGALPFFVDAEPASGNLDVELVAKALGRLRGQGRRVGAVIPVDFFGSCADYAELRPVCEEFDVPLVEDAAEALGSAHRGRPAGSLGRVAALSFNGNKIATTSGGGMLLSDDEELVARARYLAGQARNSSRYVEHAEVGFNYRLSNLLAALGRAQLVRLDEMIERRRAVREHYAKLFSDCDGVRILAADDGESNCWLTAIVVDQEAAGWAPLELAVHLEKEEIEARPIWKPLHLQQAFAGSEAELTGVAEALFRSGLALPSGSGLGQDDTDRIKTSIEDFLQTR